MSLGSLFGGIAQGAFNYQSVKETNAANKEINQMNNAFNQMMWEKEKEYNSPLAQMQRLQQAGINPAFAYSNGVSNTVSSAPTAASPIPMQPYTGSELAEMGNRMSLDSLRGVERDETKSRTRLNDKTIAVYDSDISVNEEVKKEINAKIEMISSNIQTNEATIKHLESLAKLNDSKKVEQDINNWISEATKNDKVLASELENNKIRQATNLMIQQIVESKSRVSLNKSQIKLNEEEITKLYYECRKLQSETTKINAEAGIALVQEHISLQTMADMIKLVRIQVNQGEVEFDLSELQRALLEIEKSWKETDASINNNVVYHFLNRIFGTAGQVISIGYGSRTTTVNRN